MNLRPVKLETARAGAGVIELLFAAPLTRLAGAAATSPVLKVLGFRHLLQSTLTHGAVNRGYGCRAHQVGAAVDLAHAATMAAVGVVSDRFRRVAAVDGAAAAVWAVAELREANRCRRDAAAVEPPSGAAADPDFSSAPGTVSSDGAPGETARRHRATAAELQLVVRNLASVSGGRPVAEVVAELRKAMAARQLPPQPEPWLQAVARDAAAGHMYVLGKQAARDVGEDMPLPPPPTTAVT